MAVTPLPVKRALRALGQHISTQRKLMGLTQAMVAERSGVSQPLIVRLEKGEGATLEKTLRVLRVLGMMDAVIDAADPYRTDRGRLLAGEKLPTLVRADRG